MLIPSRVLIGSMVIVTWMSISPIFAQAPVPPTFLVDSIDPTPVRGVIQSLKADGTLILESPNKSIPGGTWISLRRVDRPLPPGPRGSVVILANGDRLTGVISGGDTEALRIMPSLGAAGEAGVWNIPLANLSALWFSAPPADLPLNPAEYPWAMGPKRRDAVRLRNADVVRGTVESIGDAPLKVQIKPLGEALPTGFPLTSVTAVAFDPTLARVRTPKGPYACVVLSDGSRVSITDWTSDGAMLLGKTLFGGSLRVRLADLLALDVLQGPAVELSQLKPRKVTVVPYNGLTWNWQVNQTVKRRPLMIGESTYDRGLGTHPKTLMVYDLAGQYLRFEALVGLDTESGRRGSALITVRVDQQEAVPQTRVDATAPVRVLVDVRKAKQLEIGVDYGSSGDVQADVNWVDARLIRMQK